MSAWETIRPEIVKKIREAPTEEEALRIFELGESLLFELKETFASESKLKSLLEELGIEKETKDKILLGASLEPGE